MLRRLPISQERKKEMPLGECKPSPIISKPFIIPSLAKIQTNIVKCNALFNKSNDLLITSSLNIKLSASS